MSLPIIKEQNIKLKKGGKEMRDYFKGIAKYPVRIIPLAVCGMILAAALSIYITVFEKNEMYNRANILSNETQEMEWRILKGMIDDSYDSAKKDSKILALETEYSLRSNYPNLDELRVQLDTYSYSEKFNRILKGVLYEDQTINNNSFLTLVGTKQHLITMFSNSDDHILKDINSDKIVTWSQVIEMSANPKLTKSAIKAIINKSSGLIFIQDERSRTGNAEKIKDVSIEELRKLYETDGLAGIENISLLAAAYITDTGDIFGVDDSTFLKNNDNHKIVIVKTVNLKDVIHENQDFIDQISQTMGNLSEETKAQGDRNTLQGILWTFILFILSLLLIAVYNSEEKKGHLRDDNYIDNEGGNDRTMRGE